MFGIILAINVILVWKTKQKNIVKINVKIICTSVKLGSTPKGSREMGALKPSMANGRKD